MMKWIFSGLVVVSVVFGAFNGRMVQVSNAALSQAGEAVQLCITLAGSMCLWSGLMQVAQKSGLTKAVALILSPITGFLFKGMKRSSRAMELICMNITANMLGLGNAATPLGLSAMLELQRDAKSAGVATAYANDNMIMLVVINTASIQLIPTTVATLRLKYGSQTPMDILPAVWITSVIAIAVGVAMVKLLNKFFPTNKLKNLKKKGGLVVK